MNPNINIRLATLQDLQGVLALHEKYLYQNLSDPEKQNGFIKVRYSEDDLRKIIVAQEIVVAIYEYKIVGYFLVGKKSDSPNLLHQKNRASRLANEMVIPFDKVGYGCQICLDMNYRNLGLSRPMVDVLIENVNDKYKILLSTISPENKISIMNSTSVGWHPLNNLEIPNYYIYKL